VCALCFVFIHGEWGGFHMYSTTIRAGLFSFGLSVCVLVSVVFQSRGRCCCYCCCPLIRFCEAEDCISTRLSCKGWLPPIGIFFCFLPPSEYVAHTPRSTLLRQTIGSLKQLFCRLCKYCVHENGPQTGTVKGKRH
jgi:hypothetical protein